MSGCLHGVENANDIVVQVASSALVTRVRNDLPTALHGDALANVGEFAGDKGEGREDGDANHGLAFLVEALTAEGVSKVSTNRNRHAFRGNAGTTHASFQYMDSSAALRLQT